MGPTFEVDLEMRLILCSKGLILAGFLVVVESGIVLDRNSEMFLLVEKCSLGKGFS